MDTIRFYEKPGCINNNRQKQLLAKAGYQLDVRNLLTEPWTRQRLEQFFVGMPVAERFNRTAPKISSGLILPEALDEDTAYALMLADPLLIRRPLMEIGEHRLVGFETDRLNRILALEWDESHGGSLERCPRYLGVQCDK